MDSSNTDMAKHNDALSMLHNQLLIDHNKGEDKTTALSLLLHGADISHPSRPWKLHQQWTKMVQEEFFMQGDREKEMGVSVISLFDRLHADTIPAMQIGFINGVILPYFKPLAKFLSLKEEVITNIEHSRDKWTEFI